MKTEITVYKRKKEDVFSSGEYPLSIHEQDGNDFRLKKTASVGISPKIKNILEQELPFGAGFVDLLIYETGEKIAAIRDKRIEKSCYIKIIS